nr:hypothetical protein [Apis mellifera nudivirus]
MCCIANCSLSHVLFNSTEKFIRTCANLLFQTILTIVLNLTITTGLIIFTPLILFLNVYSTFTTTDTDTDNNTSDDSECKAIQYKPFISVIYGEDDEDVCNNDDDDNLSITTTTLPDEDVYEITHSQFGFVFDTKYDAIFVLTCNVHNGERNDGVKAFRFGLKRY